MFHKIYDKRGNLLKNPTASMKSYWAPCAQVPPQFARLPLFSPEATLFSTISANGLIYKASCVYRIN